jgi:cytochrome c biogenesis protein CcdA
MKRPCLERLFIVLWCLWGLFGLLILFVLGQDQMLFEFLLLIYALGLGLPGVFLTLLQYLVLGFFNPLEQASFNWKHIRNWRSSCCTCLG